MWNKETNKDETIFFLSVPLMSQDRDGDYYFGCDCDRFGLVTLYTVAKHLTFILLVTPPFTLYGP